HVVIAVAIGTVLALAVPVAATHEEGHHDEQPPLTQVPGIPDLVPTPEDVEPELPGTPPAGPQDKPSARRPATKPRAPLEPADYTAVAGLSQPDYPETVRDVHRVPMHDGIELYVEVVRPDPAAHGEGPWPVIMEASPYHGTLADRDGTRVFPDPEDGEGNPIGLTGYFAPRGYAVAMVGLRGTGRSGGCLDHLGPEDAKDLKDIVEWAADEPWSTGEVGMTGHSYVGSTPSLAAAMNPRGLVTIAPSAGLASMYDHQFHHGVPWFLQLAGPQASYPGLATARHLPPGLDTPIGPTGDDFGNHVLDTGCGWKNSALTAGPGQVIGQYQAWHAVRDHRTAATAADLPIFMIHGVNDNAARIPSAEWFFGERLDRAGDKVWLGQWDHGSEGLTTCEEGHINCRFDQWQYALHAWFDRHLQHRDVDTGPPVEVFLNGDQVATDDAWSAPPATVALHPDGRGGSLGAEPDGAGQASFTSVPTGPTASEGAVEFTTEPLAEDMVVIGVPRLRLTASVLTSQALNLVTGLFRVDADGERHEMGYCAIQTQLRHDVRTPALVVPGEKMQLDPQCFTMGHHIPAGEQILLRVTTSSRHHVSTHTLEGQVTVYTGPGETALTLPVVPAARLHDDDVPLFVDGPLDELPAGPAQESIPGESLALAPGAGVRSPATSSYFAFDVTEPTNASLEVAATWALPGDYDLYLQRQDADGSWSGDLAAGESPSTEDEALTHAGLPPGRYRLEVHNWAGPPGQPIDLVITFFNRDGEPGPDPQ
ncbi:MAG TPA: CocE/NonD family hydrolase, partial [Egibacteraceae bacterium]|nr:CocE/NonD family hydrolase [Egibacteraceae bacterium]